MAQAQDTYRIYTGRQLVVDIYRDGLSSPWGFNLHGGVDMDSPLTVTKVVPGTSVEGQLCVGDVIKEIGGRSIEGLTHDEAMAVILGGGSSLRLTILRNPEVVYRGGAAAVFNGHSASRSPAAPLIETEAPEKASNARLAGLMSQSLTLRDSTSPVYSSPSQKRILPQFRSQQMRTTASNGSSGGFISPTKEIKDVTAYLPKPPPKISSNIYRQTVATTYADGVYSGQDPAAARAHVREALARSPVGIGSGSGTGSGRSTPDQHAVLELKGDPQMTAVGVWTPPLHQPGSQLEHAQYNSPMGLYSAWNVADHAEKMTGSNIQWVGGKQPSVKYLNDIKDSPTYQLVQELEGGRPMRKKRMDNEQSPMIKTMNRYFNMEGLYEK